MPPKKKQRTSENSAAVTREGEEEKQQDQAEAESSAAQDVTELGDDGNEEVNTSNDDSAPLRDVVTSSQSLECSNQSQTSKIPDHEYIGMHRPHFDYEIENRILGEDSKEDEEFDDWYEAGFKTEIKAGVMLKPAKDHPNHKWVIMWEGYKMFMNYRRRSKYCSPDRFGMYIYNDFEGWGFQELIENFVRGHSKQKFRVES